MDEYLFVIPLSGGKEVSGVFLHPASGLYMTAIEVISAAAAEYPDEIITRCDVWKRTNHHTLSLVVTAYAMKPEEEFCAL